MSHDATSHAASSGKGRGRPALSLAAFVGALLVFWGSVSSPLGPAVAASLAGAVTPDPPPVPARQLAYQQSIEGMRTTAQYQAYAAAVDPSIATLYLMGSSELGSLAPENPAAYLRPHVSDSDLFLSGRGYVQSLPHALELAAVAPYLRSPQVALIISPQWFTAEGISPEAFADVFSASNYAAAMSSPQLTTATKERLAERVDGLLGAPWQAPQAEGLQAHLTAPVAELERWQAESVERLKEAAKAGRVLPATVPDVPEPGAVPFADVDWSAAHVQAELEGKAAVTNNPFGVADGYFTKYIAPTETAFKDSMATLDYAQASPEDGDLDLFLTIARELGIKVLLVSVPMNAKWHDYAGYPRERRAAYYDKIRAVADSHDVALADFSSQEYTDYFLYDIMHLGWKGWLDVSKACLEFEHAA